jgi:excinuclease ABC subunit C
VSAILKHFGSVTKVRAASVEEIAAVPGISASLAEAILRSLSLDGRPTNIEESTKKEPHT